MGFGRRQHLIALLAAGAIGCALPFDTSLIDAGSLDAAPGVDAAADAAADGGVEPCDPRVEDLVDVGLEPTPPPLPAEGALGTDPDFGSCHRTIFAGVDPSVHAAHEPVDPLEERIMTSQGSYWYVHERATGDSVRFLSSGRAFWDDDSRSFWQVNEDDEALGFCRRPVVGLRLTCEQEWPLAALLPTLVGPSYALRDATPEREFFIVDDLGDDGSAVLDLRDTSAPRVVAEHVGVEARFTPSGRYYYILDGVEITFHATEDGAEVRRHTFLLAPSDVYVTELPDEPTTFVVVHEEGDYLRYVRIGAESSGDELRDARVEVGEHGIAPVIADGGPDALGLFAVAFYSCHSSGVGCAAEVGRDLPRWSQLALIDVRVEPPRVVPFAWHFIRHRGHPLNYTRLGVTAGLRSVWLNTDWRTGPDTPGNLMEFIVPPHLLEAPTP